MQDGELKIGEFDDLFVNFCKLPIKQSEATNNRARALAKRVPEILS